MEQERRRDGLLGPRRADGNGVMRGGITFAARHGAVVLTVTAAAGGKPGIGILRKREPRRNQRKREGSEQQDGEKTTHQADGSVYGPEYSGLEKLPLLLGCAWTRRCCGLI
jgi:hypothetical protein